MEATHTFKTNQWYFVTFTWDSSRRRIYVDGLLVGQDSLNVINDGGDAYDWFIGNHPYAICNNLQRATIKIDDIRIYSRALSDGEILELYGGDVPTPKKGLVGYWNFDEGSGNTARDSSGNGNDGTIQGATRVDNGRCKNALSFDGNEDSVQIPHTVINNLLDITFSAWIKTSDGNAAILTGANSGDDNEFLIYIRSGGKLRPHVKNNVLSSEGTINDGLWHYISVVRKGNSGITQIFIDGKLDNTNTDSLATGNLKIDPNGLWLGREQDCVGDCWEISQDFDGIIDEVRIYNYALTQSEIQGDMNACRPDDTLVKKPDLTPYEITWKPSSPSTSDGINIACCVKNQGDADAVGKFYTELYVDGVKRNAWSKDGLAAGKSMKASWDIGKLSAGDHTIKVETDTTNTIGESSGTNNIYSRTLTVITVKPILCTDPDSLTHDFGTVPEGQSRDRTFDIKNCGAGTLTWTISDDKKWITVNPTRGSTTTETETVTVSIDTTGLECGKKYTGTITVSSDGDTKQGTITVYVPELGEEYIFITKWGSYGTGDGEFYYPQGITVDSSGYVFVAEWNNHRVQKFDSVGNFITKWGSRGSEDGAFEYPADIAVDSSGYVFVTDYGNGRIQKFDSVGNFITKWGSEGTGDGEFHGPSVIAVDSSGYVFVADRGNNRIQKFDSDDNFITKWGSRGTGDGEFKYPEGMAVDSSGNVYVADNLNNRIQKFGPGSPEEPTGYLWLSDFTLDKIYKLDTSGNVLTSFDSPGSLPSDLAWDGTYLWNLDKADGKIYKLDTSGNVIDSINAPGYINQYSASGGLAWDGTYLWCTDDGWEKSHINKIFKLDTAGNVIASFDASQDTGSDTAGLAWDGRYLWYVSRVTGWPVGKAPLGNEIYQLDTSGNVISHFTGPSLVCALSWDGSHLWAVDDKIYKLDTFGKVLDSFNAPGPSPFGLAFVTQAASTPVTTPENRGTSFDDAIELSDGQTLRGDVDKDEDVYYKFYLSAGQKATVTLQPLEGDQDLYICNPKRHLIEVGVNSGTETEECTVTADASGYYYAMVYGYEAGSYTITLPV